MSSNFSSICLTQQQMRMHGNEAEKYLQRFFYPLVAVLGITGNVLNLSVLLNRSMRSRSNAFLAALAIADILFLLLLIPNILANYPIFAYNYTYRSIYFHIRIHLLSFANWSSSAAVWFVILVCADRLIGIRKPLYAKIDWGKYRTPMIIVIIVIFSGAVNFYQHLQYKCIMREYCYGTQIYSKCLAVNNDGRWFRNHTNPYSLSYRKFIDVSVTVNAITSIILPIFLLSLLNVLLLCTLRNRRNFLLLSTNQKNDSKNRRRSSLHYQKMEHRITLTVALIVTTFSIMNGPSAIIHLLNLAHKYKRNYNLTLVGNTLVICGKACNFILFCLSSDHFRARLLQSTQRKISRQFIRFSICAQEFADNVREVRKCSPSVLGTGGQYLQRSRKIISISRSISLSSGHRADYPTFTRERFFSHDNFPVKL